MWPNMPEPDVAKEPDVARMIASAVVSWQDKHSVSMSHQYLLIEILYFTIYRH